MNNNSTRALNLAKDSQVLPTPQEQQHDAQWVRWHPVRGVHARQDIPPFTRVAVCFGRVFSKKAHDTLFPQGDKWSQWAPFKIGNVVTPGKPDQTLDPRFADKGAFPFFGQCKKLVEPDIICVVNIAKQRLELWVGRKGAAKDRKLCMHFSPDDSNFPSIYVYKPSMERPVSVHYLAKTQQYDILRECGWNIRNPTHQIFIHKWASLHKPTYDQPARQARKRSQPSSPASPSPARAAPARTAARTASHTRLNLLLEAIDQLNANRLNLLFAAGRQLDSTGSGRPRRVTRSPARFTE